MIRTVALIVLSVLVTACAEDPGVSAVFETVVTVSPGDDVYFADEIVGEVDKFGVENKGTRVYFHVSSNTLRQLRQGSAAMMVTKSDKPALEVYNRRDHTELLPRGGELVALNNSLEYLAWQAGESVGAAQTALMAMSKSTQEYFKSKEWARQKEEMEQSLERLGVDAQRAMEQMETDYNALVEELEAKSEKSREQVLKQYDELSASVAKQMEILLKNGEEAAAKPLRQFSEALDTLMKKYSATAPGNS